MGRALCGFSQGWSIFLTKRTVIVPRGAYNDGGRPTGAAREGEASNDLPLLSTQVTWW